MGKLIPYIDDKMIGDTMTEKIKNKMIEKALEKEINFVVKRPFLVLSVIVLSILLAAPGVLNLEQKLSLVDFLDKDCDAVKISNELEHIGVGSVSYIVIELPYEKINNENLTRIMKLQKELEKNPEITYTNSILNVIGSPNAVMLKNLPETEKTKFLFYKTDNSYKLIVYVHTKGEDLSSSEKLMRDIKGVVDKYDLSVRYGGTVPLQAEGRNMINTAGKKATIISLIAVFIILVLAFKKLFMPFLMLIPIGISIWWVLGFMGYSHIAITPVTVIFGSLLFGLGVDYSVHIVHRYNDEKDKGFYTAVKTAVTKTGKAIITTTFTTMAAFGSIIFVDSPALQDFGKICFIGMFFSMVSVLVVLPALISLKERKNMEKIKR